ncbi:MAG TPA: hypothetical protein VGH49_18705 [Xanthobacteraceae bacterium]|jgi:hypothetical protein
MMRRLAFLLPVLLLCVSPASAAGDAVNGVLTYRGFTVDMTVVETAPNRAAIEASLKKQIDIVADCAARPEIMTFFRSQKMKLKLGGGDGGGHFGSAGVEIDATPQPPEKPIVLHELLHAMHARYMPNGANNPDIDKFYRNAVSGQVYPAGEYVLTNHGEFFAVTASLYLWGYVARAPNNRETLRAKQPHYYAWLGELFGVQK